MDGLEGRPLFGEVARSQQVVNPDGYDGVHTLTTVAFVHVPINQRSNVALGGVIKYESRKQLS